MTAVLPPRRAEPVRRRSHAGAPDHPGRAHRRHPLRGRDMRDVPIPPAPPAPPTRDDGIRMVWAPWAREWQPFCAPCEVCDEVLPIRFPEGTCRRCAAIYIVFGSS